MPTPHTETIQRFAWEGPLVLWQAVALGLVMAAVFAWTLWQEGRLTHRWLLPLFWLLRAATLAAVMWMLLGPTRITVTRQTTPKSIALIADSSGSMGMVDSPSPLEDVRWLLARKTDSGTHMLVAGDRATVAAAAATEHFRDALIVLQRGNQSASAQESFTASAHAVNRLNDHLKQVSEQINGGNNASAKQADQCEQLAADLATELQSAAEMFGGTQVLSQDGTGRLHALLPRLESLSRQVGRLVSSVLSVENMSVETRTGREILDNTGLSRGERVAGVLKNAEQTWLKELSKSVRIRRYTLAEHMAAGDEKWSGSSARSATKESSTDYPAEEEDSEQMFSMTNLSAALEQISRDAAGETITAAVLLTDGRHNAPDSRGPADIAAGLGRLPVHVVPIGTSEMLRDVIVHHVDAPPAVAKDDLIAIEAIVTAYMCADETLSVELLRGDQVIDTRQLEVKSDRTDHRVSFSTKADEFGRHAFRLRVQPVDDETSEGNNFADFDVEVIEDSVRVLLADNLPRWEFRYLSNLFTRDERIDYEQLLFGPELAGTGKLQNRAAFPDDVEGWSRYRVVILGDVTPRQLDQKSQQALREYVTRRGGTVIMIAGRESMPHSFVGDPLEELLPVREASDIAENDRGFQLELTAEGKMASAMQLGDDALGGDRVWREMSRSLPVFSLSDYSRPKPTSHTFIRAVATGTVADKDNPRAFLCWQTVGRGRVVYLAAPATYQLRIRSGDRYHHQFWGQLIRWAIARDLGTGSKTVRIRTDKSSYQSGEEVQVIVQLMQLNGTPVSGATLQTTARQEDTAAASAPLEEDENIPGRYLGRLGDLAAGSFLVTVGGAEVDELLQSENVSGPIETSIAMEPSLSTEMSDTRSNRPLLGQIAELTGGQMIPPTALEEVLQTANLTPHVSEQTARRALWNNWSALSLILFCLVCEWVIRKQTGLS